MTPPGAARGMGRATVAVVVRLVLVGLVTLVGVSAAQAQTPTPNRPWELSFGANWTRGLPLPGITGTETQPNGNPFALFTAQTRLDPGIGFGASFLRHLAGPLSIEAVGSLDRLTYRTSVTADFENAALTDATNATTAFAVGGALVAVFARHARLQPFVRAGLAWRRELSEDRTLSADGGLVLAGGGVKYWIGGPAGGGRLGFTVEADAVGRSGGLLIGDTTRFAPGFSAGCLLRF